MEIYPANVNILAQLTTLKLIPVITITKANLALPLARALLDGGLACVEITFRTDAAEAAIQAIAKSHPEILLGAGTVMNPEQAEQAFNAGAKFIVSPGFSPSVADFCSSRKLPYFPGVSTPTEVQTALSRGLRVLKFFPAEPLGGINFLKALSAPFPQVKFIPTGGIHQDNFKSYLVLHCVLACGGSWMAPKDLLADGNFPEIRERVKRAVQLAAATS